MLFLNRMQNLFEKRNNFYDDHNIKPYLETAICNLYHPKYHNNTSYHDIDISYIFNNFENGLQEHKGFFKKSSLSKLNGLSIEPIKDLNQVNLTNEEYVAILTGFLFNMNITFTPLSEIDSSIPPSAIWEEMILWYEFDNKYRYLNNSNIDPNHIIDETTNILRQFYHDVRYNDDLFHGKFVLSDGALISYKLTGRFGSIDQVIWNYLSNKLSNTTFDLDACINLAIKYCLKRSYSIINTPNNYSVLYNIFDRCFYNYRLSYITFMRVITLMYPTLTDFEFSEYISNNKDNREKFKGFNYVIHSDDIRAEVVTALNQYTPLKSTDDNINILIDKSIQAYLAFIWNFYLVKYVNGSKNIINNRIKDYLFEYPVLMKELFNFYKIKLELVYDKKEIKKLENKINKLPTLTCKYYLSNKDRFKKYLNNFLNGGLRSYQWKDKRFQSGFDNSLTSLKRNDRHFITMTWIVTKLKKELLEGVDIKEKYGITDSVFTKICVDV